MPFIGDYRYSGVHLGGHAYSVIRNGDELLRVRRIAEGDERENPLLWNQSMPMTVEILAILKAEKAAALSSSPSATEKKP